MASLSHETDRALLQRIARCAGRKAGYKQLIREMGLGGGRERRLLLEQLTRLAARGELVRTPDDLWALPVPKAVRTSPAGARQNLVSGRLEIHRDGFGFVRSDAQSDDIFIPPNEVHGAMHGDLVLVDEVQSGRDGKRSGRIARVLTRRNPSVVGIFHYGGRKRRRDDHAFLPSGNYITPIDERVAATILIPESQELASALAASPHRTLGAESLAPDAYSMAPGQLEGMVVDVEITDFPSAHRPARGRVIEVLGPPDAFGVDVEIVIRKHHLPHVFPAPVLAEAEEQARRTVATLTPEEFALREDFRELPVVTIDGETAKDFDDAILVRPLSNGLTELQVHIADVSQYVQPGSALDTEARVRGTSVYFPDRAVPMLPHALSSGLCSLLPNEDRLVLSCIMEVDSAGEIVRYRLAEGIIRSAQRLTYTQVQAAIDEAEGLGSSVQGPESSAHNAVSSRSPEPWALGSGPSVVGPWLTLARRLNDKRRRRGSIDFDLPEPVIQFDPKGNMQAIVRSERGWSHRLIEEFMLSANECVAHWLEALGIASLYRIHELPDPKRIVEFEETAASFGYSLGLGSLPVRKFTMKADRRQSQRNSARGRGARPPQQHELPSHIPVTPQMYQRLVSRVQGQPEERILAHLKLRSLKQARYSEKNEGHFALASPSYTHFTSPIRRYPDLIVHRLVRSMLRAGADARGGPVLSTEEQPWSGRQGSVNRDQGSQGCATEPFADAELRDIAAESSQAERRAADAERELIDWKKMKFMQSRIGDDFAATILSVTKYGFFVELDELFIEGLVPLSSLVGDHYTFRDTNRTICGDRTGHCFRLGQRVEVLLDRVDHQQRRLQFALVPGTEPVAGGGGRRSKLRVPKRGF